MVVNRVGRFLVVVLFALLAAQTGSAAPIEEGYFAPINGTEQWITIRGRDSRNPILLFLHGGPGAAQSGTAPLFSPWEETFTVVHWDQPMSHATVFFADELLQLLNTHVRPRVMETKWER